LGLQVALTGLWGGLLVLERRAFLQAMFSRPLAAATGTGLLLDDLGAGVWIGVFFELLHLGSASLGGSHPEHDTLPPVTATAAAAMVGEAAGGPATPAVWALCILLFAPMALLGRSIEVALDARALRYAVKAEGLMSEGQLRRAARQNLWGMWPHFVAFGLLCAAAAALGPALYRFENALPLEAVRGLAWAFPAMTSVAAAVAVQGSHASHPLKLAGAGALLASALAVAKLGALWW
jgi:mannose/fructose/N-acetylgalactosamine-specific phosphotransferase system component IIC